MMQCVDILALCFRGRFWEQDFPKRIVVCEDSPSGICDYLKFM